MEKCQDERQEGEDPEKDFWQESRGQGIQVGAVWIMGKEEGMVLKKGRMECTARSRRKKGKGKLRKSTRNGNYFECRGNGKKDWRLDEKSWWRGLRDECFLMKWAIGGRSPRSRGRSGCRKGCVKGRWGGMFRLLGATGKVRVVVVKHRGNGRYIRI